MRPVPILCVPAAAELQPVVAGAASLPGVLSTVGFARDPRALPCQWKLSFCFPGQQKASRPGRNAGPNVVG